MPNKTAVDAINSVIALGLFMAIRTGYCLFMAVRELVMTLLIELHKLIYKI